MIKKITIAALLIIATNNIQTRYFSAIKSAGTRISENIHTSLSRYKVGRGAMKAWNFGVVGVVLCGAGEMYNNHLHETEIETLKKAHKKSLNGAILTTALLSSAATSASIYGIYKYLTYRKKSYQERCQQIKAIIDKNSSTEKAAQELKQFGHSKYDVLSLDTQKTGKYSAENLEKIATLLN